MPQLRSLVLAFRAHWTLPTLIAWLVIIALIPLRGFATSDNKSFRDGLDVFSFFMTSPGMLVFPLLVLCTSNLPMFAETSHRFAYQAAYRAGRVTYIASRIFASAASAFIGWFSIVLVTFVLAFFVWDGFGDFRFAPEVYEQISLADTRVTYSQWLELGPWTYGLRYALIVGLSAAAFATVTACAALAIPSGFLAGSIGIVLYFLHTLSAALSNTPTQGIMYVIFPFGLVQQPVSSVVHVWIALAALVGIGVVGVFAGRNSLGSLR